MGKLHPETPHAAIEPDLTPYLWRPTPMGRLPTTDGVPLETSWHAMQMTMLIQSLKRHWMDRSDFYVGGDMFVYWDESLARSKYFRGPDVFAVKDGVTPKPPREYWAVWEEDGRFPDLIVELLSKSTRKNDLTTKKQVYEESFRTPLLVAYDPESKELFVWRRKEDRFHRVSADKHGRFRLADVDLWIGPWHGSYEGEEADWIRFFDSAGDLLPTPEETAAAEKARADALAAELARLKSKRSS
jgi:Uma2 family endonuclease